MKSRPAFTLLELLVVIGIVALLIGILLPSLTRIRSYGRQLQCASQLRQVGAAVQLYLNDHRGVLYASQAGAQWLTTSGVVGLMPNHDRKAYWGVAYAPYLIPGTTLRRTGPDADAILRAAYGIWHCPSALVANQGGPAKAEDPLSYAVNGLITGAVPPKWRRAVEYKNSAQYVFAQDAIVSRMSSNEADTLSDFGTGSNLQQWRAGGDGYRVTQAGVAEYYRHRGRSNVLWLDGHVDALSQSMGGDVKPEWYLPPDLSAY